MILPLLGQRVIVKNVINIVHLDLDSSKGLMSDKRIGKKFEFESLLL